jgi:hypothetical protein
MRVAEDDNLVRIPNGPIIVPAAGNIQAKKVGRGRR